LENFSLRLWDICGEVWAVSIKVMATANIEVPDNED
jgi:hypothetical protein